jgi:hypothetical protein
VEIWIGIPLTGHGPRPLGRTSGLGPGNYVYLLCLETYQAAENSTYLEHTKTFGSEYFSVMTPVILSLF